ncbi:growth hormone receptor a isoform X2 [Phyllopteryx taeniolatus]|uniref:growth hormone receptor a isoform X2 n=1 Tax=Phyllopteryx taeniolatus TaxID=161469 RepID=UPI002AD4DBE6|nr:growth hormone receptor a isoform X2 [Phyllopteryx taeniolatus]XP_061623767.1 growth hormone receptor a isoform X2 [Phyllopteryx taeniolatus]XP_061623768.1 growth hormone receptor a isoform X2 [Phyllopteryx taeniolatus]
MDGWMLHWVQVSTSVMAAAASPSSGLLLFLLTSSPAWFPSPGSAFVTDWHHMTPSAPVEPHFTNCISRDQVTFSCWWTPGSFGNPSDPGALRVFYQKRVIDSPTKDEWKECPHYFHSRRECFFDRNHTTIWTTYCLQLRSRDNITYFNTDDCFTVENIVRPDPPVSLNWTCLNVSPSGQSYDVVVTWEPPPSADVAVGWMHIVYEVQYREMNSTNWEALEVQLQPQTQQTIYGLHVGKVYEVHIRCRMKAFTKFGDFSESVFIEVSKIPSKDSFSLLTLVIVLGVVAAVILIMWIVVSQQHRLMVILLPPVPAPKIKGVDSELLKKGKLNELNFILSGGGLLGSPMYSPEFYQDEPWVDFIEVDVKDPDTGEKQDDQASDTERLLGGSPHVRQRAGCSNALSDRLNIDDGALTSTLLPGQPDNKEACLCVDSERGERPPAPSGPQTWVNTDFYAQVSNVMPFGGVVLSPGQHLRTQESGPASNQSSKNEKKDGEEEEEKKQKELQFQLLVLEPDSESSTRQIIPPPYCSLPGESCRSIEPRPAEAYQSPYVSPDSPQAQLFAPVADYTVVQELDSQRSVLLDPPNLQSAQSCRLEQHPLKALPAMPVGYVTPDLQGALSP